MVHLTLKKTSIFVVMTIYVLRFLATERDFFKNWIHLLFLANETKNRKNALRFPIRLIYYNIYYYIIIRTYL